MKNPLDLIIDFEFWLRCHVFNKHDYDWYDLRSLNGREWMVCTFCDRIRKRTDVDRIIFANRMMDFYAEEAKKAVREAEKILRARP